MSICNSLDRESFERFLANVVTVQKSGLDTRSLSALIEIQRFIASDEFTLDRAMQMIADHVLELFNASGTAIAILDSNELVYRAGSGSAAKELGRRVAAVLNVCSSHDVRREILRVENAKTDTRIEAEICRQFGAISLLMLPVCENYVLVGVLEVRFHDAHSFTQREIRVCRLMIEALEEGIERCLLRTEDQKTVGAVERVPEEQVSSRRDLQPGEGAVNPTATPADAIDPKVSQRPNLTNKGAGFSYRAVAIREIESLWTSLRTAISSTTNTTCSTTSGRVGAVLSVAAILGIITSVSYVTHPFSSTKSLYDRRQLDAGQRSPAKPLRANDKSKFFSSGQHESAKPRPGFRRVQISPNEVDYIAEDVIIRRFTISPAKPQSGNDAGLTAVFLTSADRNTTPSTSLPPAEHGSGLPSGIKEVNFGDDVTVRYFAEAAAPVPQAPSPPQVEPSAKRPMRSLQ